MVGYSQTGRSERLAATHVWPAMTMPAAVNAAHRGSGSVGRCHDGRRSSAMPAGGGSLCDVSAVVPSLGGLRCSVRAERTPPTPAPSTGVQCQNRFSYARVLQQEFERSSLGSSRHGSQGLMLPAARPRLGGQ